MELRIAVLALIVSSFVAPVSSEELNHENGCIAGQRAEYGQFKKDASGIVTIRFTGRFGNPPVVFLTAYKQNDKNAVNAWPTVLTSDTDQFTFTTQISAGNFIVNWMALDRGGPRCAS